MLLSPHEIVHRHHHPPIGVHKDKIWKMPFAHDLYKLIHRVIFANTMDKGSRFTVSVLRPVLRFRPTACLTIPTRKLARNTQNADSIRSEAIVSMGNRYQLAGEFPGANGHN